MDKISGIYEIKNIKTNRIYIGHSKNITYRWYIHIMNLLNNTHSNRKLQEEFNQYGINYFTFRTLEQINDLSMLKNKEQEYLDDLYLETNYNLIHSMEQRKTNLPVFIDFINKKWLVPKGIINKEELNKYKIYKQEDKEEIIKLISKCRLLNLFYSQITFNKVINFMQDCLGYTIESNRQRFEDKKQHTYKLIIDFDEDKINYVVG